MNALHGKVAVVTGSSRGIGRATVKALTLAGADVLIAADAPEPELTGVADECRALRPGARAEHCVVDLGDPAGAQRMVDTALERFGRVDILVNNAGMRIRRAFGEFSCEDFDRLIAVNLRAPFLASQAVLPSMRANGGGRIIHVASQLGMVSSPTTSLYGLAKAALIHLTKSMALELAKDKISVNAVSPGPIETEFTSAIMSKTPGYREWREAQIPVGRWGRPEEIAEAILFLASTSATFVHGANLVVDGGFIAQ